MPTEKPVPVSKDTTPARDPMVRRDAHPLQSLRADLARMLNGFAWHLEPGPFSPGLSDFTDWRWPRLDDLSPPVDVVESDDAWLLTAELPGMAAADIDVSMSADGLTVKGEKSETHDAKRNGYRVSERRYGAFQRSFSMPPDVDRDRIEASFANGVLTVRLPRSGKSSAGTRRIEVTAA